MPHPSDTPLTQAPGTAAAAQILRGGVGFGAVAFRETAGCVVVEGSADGHADCSPSWAWLGEWSWRDPEPGVPDSKEASR